MISHIKILKFGGTSMADGEAFERAAKIVRANLGAPVVVVVSAMSGVTDALIKSLHTAENREALDEHFERHLKAAQLLGPRGLAKCHAFVENSKRELLTLLDARPATLQTQDAIAAHGEMLCARLLTMILERDFVPAIYVDARNFILTDDEHGSANPIIHEVDHRTRAELEPLLAAKQVPVLGGFMGATLAGVTTTLGRGSSDYSATLVGAALKADEIQIWTDVDGVQTADPKVVTSTRTVPIISYEEAAQLAILGARVMHPKMIEPVIEDQIPIRIRNSRLPEQNGTTICGASEKSPCLVKAIAHSLNSTHAIVGCVGDGLGNGSQDAAEVRRALQQIDLKLNWQSTAANNLVTTVDRDLVSIIVRQLHQRLFN